MEDLGKCTGVSFRGYWTKDNFKITPKVAKKFVGLPVKDEEGNIIGKVVSAEMDRPKSNSISYHISLN